MINHFFLRFQMFRADEEAPGPWLVSPPPKVLRDVDHDTDRRMAEAEAWWEAGDTGT